MREFSTCIIGRHASWFPFSQKSVRISKFQTTIIVESWSTRTHACCYFIHTSVIWIEDGRLGVIQMILSFSTANITQDDHLWFYFLAQFTGPNAAACDKSTFTLWNAASWNDGWVTFLRLLACWNNNLDHETAWVKLLPSVRSTFSYSYAGLKLARRNRFYFKMFLSKFMLQ